MSFPVFLAGQTILSGEIQGLVTLDKNGSPYLVSEDLIVPQMSVLIVSAGAEVVFAPERSLRVEGVLQLSGVANNPAVLRGDSLPWEGVTVVPGGIFTIRNAEIRGAQTGLRIQSVNSSNDILRNCAFLDNRVGLKIEGGNPLLLVSNVFERNDTGLIGPLLTLDRCTFRENTVGAMLTNGWIERCGFYSNQELGVVLNNGWMLDSEFRKNGLGARLILVEDGRVERNAFVDNPLSLQINAVKPGEYELGQNVFCGYDLYAVDIATNDEVDLRENCWCTADSQEIANAISLSIPNLGNGNVLFVPFDSTCSYDLVYPGDANYDRLADARDILPIGLFYGRNGPVRTNASPAWLGQPAPNWGDSMANTVDIKHADCNGDGWIDSLDIALILANYNSQHNSFKVGPSPDTLGPLFSLDIPQNGLSPGDTVVIPLVMGSIDTPLVDLYGLAFAVDYDTSLIKPGSISVSYDSSWIGQHGQNMLALEKDFFAEGHLDIGITRINQQSVAGYGRMADITIVIDDDISKKMRPLELEIEAVYAIDHHGERLEVATRRPRLRVQTPVPPAPAQTQPASGLSVFPNPAHDRLVIQYPALDLQWIQISDLQGRVLHRVQDPGSSRLELDIRNLAPGTYILQAADQQRGYSQLLIISRPD